MVKWAFRRKEWEPQCKNMCVCVKNGASGREGCLMERSGDSSGNVRNIAKERNGT